MLDRIIAELCELRFTQWVELVYWIGGAILAILAIISLRQSASQARAGFLLRVHERWEAIEAARTKMGGTFNQIKSKVYSDQAHFADAQRQEMLRDECMKVVAETRKSDIPTYQAFMEFLSFFEFVGLMVRQRYVSLCDVVLLYKGPILNADILFRRHIEERQKIAGTPKGLFENALLLMDRTRELDHQSQGQI